MVVRQQVSGPRELPNHVQCLHAWRWGLLSATESESPGTKSCFVDICCLIWMLWFCEFVLEVLFFCSSV